MKKQHDDAVRGAAEAVQQGEAVADFEAVVLCSRSSTTSVDGTAFAFDAVDLYVGTVNCELRQ